MWATPYLLIKFQQGDSSPRATLGSSTQIEQCYLHKYLCTFTVPFHFPFVPYSSPVMRDTFAQVASWQQLFAYFWICTRLLVLTTINTLSTDTSCIKIWVCCQVLLSFMTSVRGFSDPPDSVTPSHCVLRFSDPPLIESCDSVNPAGLSEPLAISACMHQQSLWYYSTHQSPSQGSQWRFVWC